ncbi:MAG TPA: hypothetical protein ENG63_00640 [Candidatus Desulfofervidus auxilii]|uniref:DUF304 domain-containing protein n=1 Tax=Desulfofervidus auxilii TaxID=1621989 RepID=A0A7C0U1B6_DESA2|nr:hypothetical protein [Candidatus Desulfofervidus auxilii]
MSQTISSDDVKVYKPNYKFTIIAYAGIMGFLTVVTVAKCGFIIGPIIGYLVIFVVLAYIELFVFARAVEFHKQEMRIYTGLGYIFGLPPKKVRYDQITAIKENISVKAKFSNLTIKTKDKIYTIFIRGIENYDEMKKDLLSRKPSSVEIKIIHYGSRG